MSWEAFGSIATAVGVIVAGVAIRHDHKQAAFSSSISLMLQMLDRFESDAMRGHRSRAARHLLGDTKVGLQGIESLDYLLNFFDTTALLWRRGALDLEAVWHSFTPWILPYSQAAQDYILEQRAKDSSAYADFLKLAHEVRKMDIEKRGFEDTARQGITKPFDGFLKYESALVA